MKVCKMKKRLFLAVLPLVPVFVSAMTLTDATQKVIETNPEYIEQVKNFNAVREDVSIAYGAYLPTLDVEAATGEEKVNSASTSFIETTFTRKEAQVVLKENIFKGFNDINEVDKQKMRLKSAAYKVVEKANDITLQMTEAYLNVLREKELLTIATENAKTHTKYFMQVEKRTKAGFGSTAELNQVGSRLALANSSMMTQKISFQNALATFMKVYASDFTAKGLEKPIIKLELPKSMQEALAIALEFNPSVKVNYYNYLAADKNFKKAKSAFLPEIDLEFSATDNENISGIEGINDTTAVMLRLKYNLYNGGVDKANRQKSLSLMHQEQQKFGTTKRKVREFLQEAWNSYTLISEQMGFFAKHVKLAKTTVNSYHKEFKLGRRNLLDLLIAEGEHNSARQSFVNGDYDLLYAKYKLKNAMGSLLPLFDIQIASTVGLEENVEIIVKKDDYIDVK